MKIVFINFLTVQARSFFQILFSSMEYPPPEINPASAVDLWLYLFFFPYQISKSLGVFTFRTYEFFTPSPTDINATFCLFDADGNGKITRGELREAIKALGKPISERDLDAMLSCVDSDGLWTITIVMM